MFANLGAAKIGTGNVREVDEAKTEGVCLTTEDLEDLDQRLSPCSRLLLTQHVHQEGESEKLSAGPHCFREARRRLPELAPPQQYSS